MICRQTKGIICQHINGIICQHTNGIICQHTNGIICQHTMWIICRCMITDDSFRLVTINDDRWFPLYYDICFTLYDDRWFPLYHDTRFTLYADRWYVFITPPVASEFTPIPFHTRKAGFSAVCMLIFNILCSVLWTVVLKIPL
jgi:hypothetical protein